MSAIDLNRGVMIKHHLASGVYVYMYLADPGVYLNHFGKPVAEEMAKEAGYEVEKLAREHLKIVRMAQAMSAIEMELQLAADSTEETILLERGGYKVVKLALGNANVFEMETGEKVNSRPIPEQEALKLLSHLAPVLAPTELQPKET